MTDHPSEQALADRFVAALQTIERDGAAAVEPMAALFSESATLTNSALEQRGAKLQGRAGVTDFWRRYAEAFAGASTTFSHVTFGNGAIGLFWSTEGVPAADRSPRKTYPGATLLEHDDSGAITSFRGYYDSDALKSRSVPNQA